MKMTKRFRVLTVAIPIITAIVFLTLFYKTEKKDWGKAVKQNTIESYTQYLENHPEGSNIEQAKEQIMQMKTPKGMVYVKGSTFLMGCNREQESDCPEDEIPVHTVTLSSFYIGATEVTNAEFCEFLNAYGSDTVKSGEYMGQLMIIEYIWGVKKNENNVWQPQTGFENHPVVPATWFGANEYCKWRGGRLPTEAEWEYAARGGQNSKSTIYAGSNNIDEVAWNWGNATNENSSRPDKHVTMPVKQKAPNELGIHDMTGNIWEWCEDWYKADFYSQSGNTENPQCDEGDKVLKVLRGGSWYNDSNGCRIFHRGWRKPDGYTSIFGIRLVIP